MKAQAKKLVDTRKFEEHGVLPKEVRNYSLTKKKENNDDSLHIKIIKPKDLDISEIALEDDQRLMIPDNDSKKAIKNPVLKKLK